MPGRSLTLVPLIRVTLTVILAVAIFAAMLAIDAAMNARASTKGAFAVWAGAATMGLLAWTAVFINGIGRLKGLESPWRPYTSWVVRGALLLLIVAVGAFAFVYIAAGEIGRSGGDPGATLLARVLTVLGWVAASPWLFLVWITQERIRRLRAEIPRAGVLASLHELDAVWQAIERSSISLGLILSTLVINTALMRNVSIASRAPASSFSSWEVIGYGVFFMVILAVILLPVLAGWRDGGFDIVAHAVPDAIDGIPTQDEAASRERLVVRLGIDRSYVRRPIAIFGLLSPFITAFITALIPAKL